MLSLSYRFLLFKSKIFCCHGIHKVHPLKSFRWDKEIKNKKRRRIDLHCIWCFKFPAAKDRKSILIKVGKYFICSFQKPGANQNA